MYVLEPLYGWTPCPPENDPLPLLGQLALAKMVGGAPKDPAGCF
jgi:hypothetical protein